MKSSLGTLLSAVGLLVVPVLVTGCDGDGGEEERLPSAVQVAFDVELGDGFWSFPFPSDLRTVTSDDAPGNHPDWSGFPNPGDSDMLDDFIDFASSKQGGAGLSSPVWFRFDGDVEDLAWGEAEMAASGRCEGPIRVVDVDPDSAWRGTCVPLRYRWVAQAHGDPWLTDHMAMIAPYWGFPLRGDTTYAAYMVDVVDGEGLWLEGPPALQAILDGTSGDAELVEVYQPLTDLLAEDPALAGDQGTRWIAAATVFTTQDVRTEMDLLADVVLTDPDLPAWNDDEGLYMLVDGDDRYNADFDLYDGSYTALNFQRGDIPYSSEGGDFVWDGDVPVPQMEERIPFVIGTPRHTHEQPAAGWPVILHAHGTGGDRWSHLADSNPSNWGASRGFLSIGIPQPIHGDRWPEGNDLSISLYSFNYFNPDSGTSMFRQGALDTVALARFVREALTEGGAVAQEYPELRIDPDEIYFLGHSQGGITGAIAAPFTEGVKGWVLSGAGGGLSMTMMQRTDPIDIKATLVTSLGAPDGIDVYEEHPLVGLVQGSAERTDPLNYAPLWIAESVGAPISLLLTEGMLDSQTPPDTSEALAVAGRLPIAEPYSQRDVFGLELRGLDPLDTPYSGNLTHPDGSEVTAGLAQFDSEHWAIFDLPSAGSLWANFFYSMVRDGGPGELGADFP